MSGLAQLVRHTLRALGALCCLVSTARAESGASQPAEPFRLVWSSSAGCGDAQAFSSQLKGRTALLRSAEHDEHGLTFIVETYRDGEGVRGHLTVRRPDGELTVRVVPGASCQEVSSAMALIAALTVDPLASGLATVHRPPPEEPTLPQQLSPSPMPPWSVRMEHRLIAQSAVAPRVAWGQAARLVVTRESSDWQPSLSLGAHFVRATTSVPAGSAELEWAAAQLSVCPAGTRPTPRWEVRACAAFQLGRLRGLGFGTPSQASHSILWLAAGAQLEGRWEVVGPLWLGLEGALTLPATREKFYLDPQQTLHRVPAWAGSFGVGAGLRFF